MWKNIFGITVVSILSLCVNLDAATSQPTTTSSSSNRNAKIQEIDQKISAWQSIQKKYKSKEYIDQDEAERMLGQDWLQYKQDLQEVQTDEEALQYIQDKIDALQKEKDGLTK